MYLHIHSPFAVVISSPSKLVVALPRETGEPKGVLGGVCMLHRIFHSTYTLQQIGHSTLEVQHGGEDSSNRQLIYGKK